MAGHRQNQPRPGPRTDQVYPTANQFAAAYGRSGEQTPALVQYLLDCGYGTRKIGEFLPFATNEARAMVQGLRTGDGSETGPRPVPGEAAEIELVRYLRRLGAPLSRIAALLDGNDADNLTRIEGY